MKWSEYEKLYAELETDGTIDRVAQLEGRKLMFATSELLSEFWNGLIDCSSVECCANDGVFFLGGDPYCLKHTMRIVEGFEHDNLLRQQVEEATARVDAAYEGDDYEALEHALAELEAAESALALALG